MSHFPANSTPGHPDIPKTLVLKGDFSSFGLSVRAATCYKLCAKHGLLSGVEEKRYNGAEDVHVDHTKLPALFAKMADMLDRLNATSVSLERRARYVSALVRFVLEEAASDAAKPLACLCVPVAFDGSQNSCHCYNSGVTVFVSLPQQGGQDD